MSLSKILKYARSQKVIRTSPQKVFAHYENMQGLKEKTDRLEQKKEFKAFQHQRNNCLDSFVLQSSKAVMICRWTSKFLELKNSKPQNAL